MRLRENTRARPAFGSPAHNGNQATVLNAIKQGVSEAKAIATWISLDIEAVRNAIKRLQDAGLIRRKPLGGYEAVVKQCALGDTWR